MAQVIFLDIDGVALPGKTYQINKFLKRCDLKYPQRVIEKNGLESCDTFTQFDIESATWLSELMAKTGAKIVINSCWGIGGQAELAGYPLMQALQMTDYSFLYFPSGNINEAVTEYGKFSMGDNTVKWPRKVAVEEYLKKHPEITDHVIFDDEGYEYFDEDDQECPAELVLCDGMNGITFDNYNRALEILNSPSERRMFA